MLETWDIFNQKFKNSLLSFFEGKTEVQGWPTQIGLWATLRKIAKNIDFLGHFITKFEEKHPKYKKNLNFGTRLVRRNIFLVSKPIMRF
jgi:hypothetical protein